MDTYTAVDHACREVGIKTPNHHSAGRWMKTDTLSGANGRGDGRVFIGERVVTAWNWQTNEKAVVRIGDDTRRERDPDAMRAYAQRMEQERRRRARRAAETQQLALQLLAAGTLRTHPYLALKGFPAEKVLTVEADTVASLFRRFERTVSDDMGSRAIVIPARAGKVVVSAQLIWEDGHKRFLFGGPMGGVVHRIAQGAGTWLCEGFATGLSLRAALRGMGRQDGILMTFMSSNLPAVARTISGPCWIASDHDKPMEQFDGLGTGEHYARLAGRPFAIPPDQGDDINDMHLGQGVYAVQRLLGETIRRVSP